MGLLDHPFFSLSIVLGTLKKKMKLVGNRNRDSFVALWVCACMVAIEIVSGASEGQAMEPEASSTPRDAEWARVLFANNSNDNQLTQVPKDSAVVSKQYYGVTCSQQESCEFFRDVLLIIKLNPTRLLWVDALLSFYGTGFPNIVFYSALRKGDESKEKWLRIGSRRVLIRLLDDNYGFCDHYTLADASQRFPTFRGYYFLSDDVLLMYWKLTLYDKKNIWKQKPSFNPKTDRIDPGTLAAIDELNTKYPTLRTSRTINIFAATSGSYYVPNYPWMIETFRHISEILLKHRSYNEWGTPLLLDLLEKFAEKRIGPASPQATQLNSLPSFEVTFLRGKLAWGWKRILVKKMLARAYSWYHPVRASGELFTRLLILTQEKQLKATDSVGIEIFTEKCLNCATFPPKWRQTKGLLHGCVVAKNPALCTQDDTRALWPKVHDAALIGGKVFVPDDRHSVNTDLELEHEGFWNKEITLFVYEKYYDWINQTIQKGRLISPYPVCCEEPD